MLGLMLSGLTIFAMDDHEGHPQPSSSSTDQQAELSQEEDSYVTYNQDKIKRHFQSNEIPQGLDPQQQLRMVHAFNAALLKLTLFTQSGNPSLGEFGIDDEGDVIEQIKPKIATATFTEKALSDAEITKIALNHLPDNIQKHMKPGWLETMLKAVGHYKSPSNKRLFLTFELAKRDFYSRNCFLVNEFLNICNLNNHVDISLQFKNNLEIQKQNFNNSQDREIVDIMIKYIENSNNIDPNSSDLQKIIAEKLTLREKYYLFDKQDLFSNEVDRNNLVIQNKNIETAYMLYCAAQLQVEIFKDEIVYKYRPEATNYLNTTMLNKIKALIPDEPGQTMSVSPSWLYTTFNDAWLEEMKKNAYLTSEEDVNETSEEEGAKKIQAHKLKNYLARFAPIFCQQNVWLVTMLVELTKVNYFYNHYIPTLNNLIACMQEQQRFYKAQKNAFKAQNVIARTASRTWHKLAGQRAEAHLNDKIIDILIEWARGEIRISKERIAQQARQLQKYTQQKDEEARRAEAARLAKQVIDATLMQREKAAQEKTDAEAEARIKQEEPEDIKVDTADQKGAIEDALEKNPAKYLELIKNMKVSPHKTASLGSIQITHPDKDIFILRHSRVKGKNKGVEYISQELIDGLQHILSGDN
ncbi:MAG: hypothetical protein US49_C0009G0009 [candidate division TM6 bacterium GW2011_GWF2_37_49]|nr:MAG: hypothetical protein US49_C0009G0009 [candidate division TM6 bacterium GW2011_GWF2_37_49]